MTIRRWMNAMENGKTTGTRASGFESSWMNAMNVMQEHLTNHAQALLDPQEAWKLWTNTTLNIWHDAINMGGDPLGMTAGWVKVMENIRERAQAGQPLPVDPFELFQEWYDAMSKPWSRTVEKGIASEQFLALVSPGLENYSYLVKTLRLASEACFKVLRLPTTSDIARVAQMVVDLEEKVDAIEETIERGKERQLTQGTATMTRIADVEQRLNQIETKLERMLTLLEKVEARTSEGPATPPSRAATTRAAKKTQAKRESSGHSAKEHEQSEAM